MKKIIFILITVFVFSPDLSAQNFTYLDIGNVRALINSDGLLFQDKLNLTAAYEVPKNSNKYTIYSSALWLTSTSQRNGIPHIASAYEKFGFDNKFKTGPVDIVNQLGDQSSQFQRLWKVNKTEVNAHIQSWNTSGYTTPQNILDWPGNGNMNTAQNLAPYMDLNGNNIYEPLIGEYPIIKGDQAVYLILNDYRAEDTLMFNGSIHETGGPLKIEIHMMLYAFNSNITAISNTVFVETTVYNRSNSSIDDHSDLKASVYADFDLGNPSDDYIGTAVPNNLMYAYNGDMFDDDVSGMSGYNSQLAAQGVLFLDYAIDHSVYYNIGSSNNGDPTIPSHYAYYQRGKWKNGLQMKYGGDGFTSSCITSAPTKLMYDGNPNAPNQTNLWTEKSPCIGSVSASNSNGDRRMVGGSNIPQNLHHGQSLTFNYAYVFAQDNAPSSSIGSPVAKLIQESNIVQAFYDNTITNVDSEVKTEVKVKFFPNPANNNLFFESEIEDFTVSLVDIKGSVLLVERNPRMLDISTYFNGIYFLRFESNESVSTKKLIISKY